MADVRLHKQGLNGLVPFSSLNESFSLRRWLTHRKPLARSAPGLTDKKAWQQTDPNRKTLWYFWMLPSVLRMRQIENVVKSLGFIRKCCYICSRDKSPFVRFKNGFFKFK